MAQRIGPKSATAVSHAGTTLAAVFTIHLNQEVECAVGNGSMRRFCCIDLCNRKGVQLLCFVNDDLISFNWKD